MSKVKQAIKYENKLARERVEAHKVLTDQAIDYERKLTDSLVEGQVRVRDEAFAYERKITDAQFDTLKALAAEHRLFHDREHILYDDAVEKASESLRGQLATLQMDLDRLMETSHTFMSTGRFEREHQQLIDRMDAKFETYDEKIGVEEKVTVRQSAQEDLLQRISSSNRWMLGIMVTVLIFGIGTILNILNII